MDRNPRRSTSALIELFRPFASFFRVEALGGTLLLAAAVAALVWANSGFREAYLSLWELPLVVGIASWSIDEHLLFWVNDLLMAFFFLLVGMEIKRELLVGELASPRKAALPILAAVGGMLVPAALYTAIAHGSGAARAWGVPMATDIAFALGVLRVLGDRIPKGLVAYLAALAIIDDLGAILVIAIFYSSSISWVALLVAAVIALALVAMNRLGVDRPGLYVLLGLPLWVAVHSSGIHATIAGVIVGMCIPARSRASAEQVFADAESLTAVARDPASTEGTVTGALGALRDRVRALESPLASFEHALNPWVGFLIVPLFALANAGVVLVGASPAFLLEPAAFGVIVGLVLGKPIGIIGVTILAVKTGVASLPSGVTGRHILGAGILGGIGFTMSLFVAGLAFEPGSALHVQAKIGILVASLIAGVAGLLVLRGAPTSGARTQAPSEGRPTSSRASAIRAGST
ncbi:Na+/H+ antiporter NhaA [Vulgatibacter incomptus]|uniref:Na(+)/H(+) antiporter NhaA n=1 Tax=Vulgatibacter incomptus TaxID=1391653 RepID=A0A0K1P9A5_9BACT|nr:Na+/H+ antiporter NhaA [Vulgatibacter incomptus]AKU90118.1 Na+/H+ antiporter NhaA type [Vulgatibacter incomptus]